MRKVGCLLHGTISNWPVKSSVVILVVIEMLESNQSHYMIFVFIRELTNARFLERPDNLTSRFTRVLN
jgi:hypothetical protein